MLHYPSVSGVDVAIGFSMDAVCASCRCLDDCIPWRFSGIALAVGVDFSYSTDCVERKRIGTDADDRALLYLVWCSIADLGKS